MINQSILTAAPPSSSLFPDKRMRRFNRNKNKSYKMGTKVLPAVGMTACLEGALKRPKEKKTVSHYSVPGMMRMVAPPSDIEVYIGSCSQLCAFGLWPQDFPLQHQRLSDHCLALSIFFKLHQSIAEMGHGVQRALVLWTVHLRAASATLSCTRQSFSILTLPAECLRNVSICHQRIRMSGPNICNSIASPSRHIATASACLPDASFNNVAKLSRVVKI